MPDLNWDDLRVILAVARRRSYADAARILSVNETTVSRRIAKCEAALGVRLFDRADGRHVPTQAGEEIARRAERIEREVQSATETVADRDLAVAGRVQITAVPQIVNRLIAPRIGELIRVHPFLETHLVAEPAALSLMRRETDIAVRLARPQNEPQAVTRRICDMRYGIYASRAANSQTSDWITFTEDMRFLPQYRWIADQLKGSSGNLSGIRVSDAETLLQAIRAGGGKSFLPTWIGDSDPELARVDTGDTLWTREVWMIIHPELKNLARIRVIADWLSAILQERLK